jgi:hypothetical protein
MGDIILTEEQLAKVIHLIKKSKNLVNEISHAPTYSLRDLERAFDAGQEMVWDGLDQSSQSPKYEKFRDWFDEFSYAKRQLGENKEGSRMSKQHLFTIATLAYKMWEKLPDDEELEDWMDSKIAQAEQSVVAVTKAYMYDDVEDKLKGMDKLDHNDLVIGN